MRAVDCFNGLLQKKGSVHTHLSMICIICVFEKNYGFKCKCQRWCDKMIERKKSLQGGNYEFWWSSLKVIISFDVLLLLSKCDYERKVGLSHGQHYVRVILIKGSYIISPSTTQKATCHEKGILGTTFLVWLSFRVLYNL